MTDPATFYQQTYQNLLHLNERAAKYGRHVPPELLSQIEAHEKAIFLTRQRLDSLISADDWQDAVEALRLALELEVADSASPGPVIISTGEDVFAPMTEYNLTNIRELLTKGFSDTELRNFCFDQPEFREVYEQLAYGTGKEQIISLLLEHADQNLLFEQLLAWARQRNPGRYQRHAPYTLRPGRPATQPEAPGPPTPGPIIYVQGDINMGDQFNLSGDFRGAILNIKSTLSNVSQSVNAIPHGDENLKTELQRLIQELSAALQQAPPEQAEAAEAVAVSAEQLVKAATDEKPNKTLLQISGEGLKQAAQNLAAVLPLVLPIATQIVETVRKFGG
jgi:hypothetical protein